MTGRSPAVMAASLPIRDRPGPAGSWLRLRRCKWLRETPDGRTAVYAGGGEQCHSGEGHDGSALQRLASVRGRDGPVRFAGPSGGRCRSGPGQVRTAAGCGSGMLGRVVRMMSVTLVTRLQSTISQAGKNSRLASWTAARGKPATASQRGSVPWRSPSTFFTISTRTFLFLSNDKRGNDFVIEA